MGTIGGIIFLAIIVLQIAALWKVFAKAGEPGWVCLVPIYNLIVLLQIIGRPVWWFLLFLVPLVNIVIAFVLAIDLAKKFGKSSAFGIGLALLPPIFYPILGFGDAKYQG